MLKSLPVHRTEKGVKVRLGDMYLNEQGHAFFTAPAYREYEGLNAPANSAADLIAKFAETVTRMEKELKKKGV